MAMAVEAMAMAVPHMEAVMAMAQGLFPVLTAVMVQVPVMVSHLLDSFKL